ncbi:MAG: site-specific integrase [Verrucomicrobia bacterium]|nr:site-specific integrase [Verrucomicrobiota bacterium]
MTVGLQTTDAAVARVKLRELIVQAQREAAGLATKREDERAKLSGLLVTYRCDLTAQGCREKHVKATLRRIRNCFDVTGWTVTGDMKPQGFVAWRAGLKGAVKTRKEYETSVHAFLNWLVRAEVIEANPLAKIGKINARGRQLKPTRAYTEGDLRRLFALRTQRVCAYQVLTYTGLRKGELKGLLWSDVELTGDAPHVRLRESGTKDRADRVVPLHPVAVAAFVAVRDAVGAERKERVFDGIFPTWEAFKRDLSSAGIERRDAAGRVVNFQAFRKTFQTLGARHGLNQRSAQELLGHSDANLTAKAYTDAAALTLRPEVLKLPDLTADALSNAQKAGKGFALADLMGRLKALVTELVTEVKASSGMVVGEGFEPS